MDNFKTESKHIKDDEFILQKAVEDFMYESSRIMLKFPKHEKFVLAAKIRTLTYDLLELIIRANKRYHKKTTIQDADITLGCIKSFLVVAYELRYVSPKDYNLMVEQLSTVGKLLGGWMKWVKDNQPKS